MNLEEKTRVSSVGPWGGQNGAKWDDGVNSGIRQVVICHGAAIESIQIEYDRNGSSVWSEKHGGAGGLRTNKIKLEYPEEFLVSVSGHYGSMVEHGQVLVRSLTLESNRRKYGPFGIQHGTHFALPTSGGKVVGFHGRSSWHLDSIGVYLKPLLPKILSNYSTNSTVINQFEEEKKYKNVIYVQCDGSGGDKYKGYGDFDLEMLNSAMLTGDILRAPSIDSWKTMSPEAWGANRTMFDQFDVQKTKNVRVVTSTRDTIEGSPPPLAIVNTRKAGPFGPWRGNSTATLDVEAENTGKVPGAISTPQARNFNGIPESSTRNAVTYGPWGGSGGAIFNDGMFSGVREVHIARHGGLIVSMRVCYDSNGQEIWGNRNGGSEGIRLDKIAFDYPSEILTHISGCFGPTTSGGPMVVKSLTFHTNKRKYGPLGDHEQGVPFSSASSNKGRIVGFHGRKGRFVDSIGVHVLEEPLPLPAPSPLPSRMSYDSFTATSPKSHEVSPVTTKEVAQSSLSILPSIAKISSNKASEVAPKTVKEVAPPPSKCGPWGGNGGKPWDDGVFGGVKSIYLSKGEVIYCIQIEYDRNGQSVWSKRHGSGSERTSNTIKLDYPNEVLTGISGYYDSLSGDDTNLVIKSLTFITNKGKHGPYGEESGTSFSGKAQDQGKIVGFHGRSGCFLNSIGVHQVQP